MFPRIHARDLFGPGRACARAAIFDMDGVLVDTEELHIRAWAELARAHALYPPGHEPGAAGGSAAMALIRSTFGQTNDTIIPLLWRHARKDLRQDLLPALSFEKEAYFRAVSRDTVQALPGLERLLHWLVRAGVPTAIGTSGPPENVRFIVEEFGWRDLFSALVDRSRFAGGKPEPDCFLKAASELRIRPREAVVFEDSVHGLVAARRGGFRAAAIASTHEPDELRQHSRWVFRDFREISC